MTGSPYRTEREMYDPVKKWLHRFLGDRFKSAQVQTYDASRKKLSQLIEDEGIYNGLPPDWTTWEIQVDVVGFAFTPKVSYLALVECKNEFLSLEHLAQLLGYARIARPRYAFLISPQGFIGPLVQLLKTYQRLDVLEYTHEPDRASRALVLARWDANAIDFASIITTDSQKVELNKVHR